MEKNLSLFDFSYIDNHADHTLFLFHGTGGGKNDFLFLDEMINHEVNLVGLQGNVDENGMARFFKRDANGVFDRKNIEEEATKLRLWITAWIEKHALSIDHCSFLGYSNGANMLLAMIFLYPDIMKHVILLHPMLPFIPDESLQIPTHTLFVSMGLHDPLVSPQQQSALINTLKTIKAECTVKEYQSGHQITAEEIHDVVTYVNTHKTA